MALAPGDAIVQGHFSIDIDGTSIAQFTECSGGTSEFDVIDYKYQTPDGKFVIAKLPGALKTPTITLKRGMTDDKKIWDWHWQGVQGNVAQARRNGSIIFNDSMGGELIRYNFTNGMVSKVTFGSQQAGGNSIQLEECTIVAETFELAS